MRVAAHGLVDDLPGGWEARITRTGTGTGALAPASAGVPSAGVPSAGLPVDGAVAHALAHFATFALPDQRGDHGSGAVDRMTADDAFVVLAEHGPDSVGTALFAPVGLPRILRPGHFAARALQRTIDGQGGHQRFFNEAGRAFSLYVVLGSLDRAAVVVPRVNAVLRTIRIDPGLVVR